MASLQNCTALGIILSLVLLFPFYILFIQSLLNRGSYEDHSKNTLDKTSNLSIVETDVEYIHSVEKILDSLEEQHKMLKEVIAHVDTLIDQATNIIDHSSISNSQLSSIKSSLITSQSKIHDLTESSGPRVVGKVFPDPITLSTSNHGTTSILVVGGTDGSGTRRVVQLLTDLGVLMVSEDPETYDIHADLVGGWPPTVNSVLSETKSLLYTVNSLSSSTLERALNAVIKIIHQAASDSSKPTSHILAVGGQLPRTKDVEAKHIKFGFKAPVAMTLTPLWDHVVDDFRFLHVLRDGRDIAFSANQGPVEKFYNTMYGTNTGEIQIKAMQLWSDWNSQIYEWATNRAKTSSEKPFSYFAIHSEDLVDERINVRFSAIYNLAQWTGSNLTNDELCCLSMKGTEFMGSHDRTPRDQVKSDKQVNKRYGKWKDYLKNNPTLSNKLHDTGMKALKLFGYEPERDFPGDYDTTSSGYQCTLTEKTCQDKRINRLAKPPPKTGLDILNSSVSSPMYSVDNKCKTYIDVDFKGGNSDDTMNNSSNE